MPGATSSFLLLVAMPFVPGSFLLSVAMHLVTRATACHSHLPVTHLLQEPQSSGPRTTAQGRAEGDHVGLQGAELGGLEDYGPSQSSRIRVQCR